MTILQVITRFDYGGAENYVREVSNELTRTGHNVLIYSRPGRQTELLHPAVKHIKAALGFRTLLVQLIQLITLCVKYRVQIIHAHQRLAIASSCIAGYLLRVPVVVTVHGRARRDLRSVISRRIPVRYIFVSSRVLRVSRYYDQLRARSVVIPNGISITAGENSHHPYRLGYECRMDSKHLKVLRQLIGLLPLLKEDFRGISLAVMGDGKALKLLRILKEELNTELGYEAIVLHGYVSHFGKLNPKPEIMLGVGRVAIEALAHGCSVISLNSARMGTLVTPDNYEFYKENNFVDVMAEPPTNAGIVNGIKKYFKHRETHMKERAQLASMALNDFCIDRAAAAISKIYHEAVLKGVTQSM